MLPDRSSWTLRAPKASISTYRVVFLSLLHEFDTEYIQYNLYFRGGVRPSISSRLVVDRLRCVSATSWVFTALPYSDKIARAPSNIGPCRVTGYQSSDLSQVRTPRLDPIYEATVVFFH